MTPTQRVLICADHGLAIVYFLQSEVVPKLLEAGVEVVMLVDDDVCSVLRDKFGRPGLIFEPLRLAQTRAFEHSHRPELQWWLHFLRRVGGSGRINTQAMDSYVRQVAVEQATRRRLLMPLAWAAIGLLRRSSRARGLLVELQSRITPGMYTGLFERYEPALVIASTPGWRYDRYLLREAKDLGIHTATVIVGWDNPSSYAVPGAKVDFINCWSELQKRELVEGSDWPEERVHIGGIPSYDRYFDRSWVMPRQDYFDLHGLDPDRALLAYACSFVTFSPNYPNVEALAELVDSGGLGRPAQLLVRLHPNHFLDDPLFSGERQRIRELAANHPQIHVVEPVPLGGGLGHYSGEDMPEKASMMAYADVFVTVYSTMVVEAAIHDRPIVSLCIDQPGGWNWPRKYSLPLSEIGGWPTHQRFRQAGAGRVAFTPEEARLAINAYFDDPGRDGESRCRFVREEVTYTDGSAGRRTAEFLISCLDQGRKPGYGSH